MPEQGFFIEWNGDHWQSVFPERLAHNSQNHDSVQDAVDYFRELGYTFDRIQVFPE